MKKLAALIPVFAFASFYPLITRATDDVVTLHGKVYESVTRKLITTDVRVYLYYDTDFGKSDSCKTNNGLFTKRLSKMGWYIVMLSAPEYQDSQDTLWVLSAHAPIIEHEFFLTPKHAVLANLELEKKVVHETASYKPVATDNTFAVSIFFPFGKSDLPPTAAPGLSALADHLKTNPGVALEVFGYTDADGADDYNLMLSQWRAEGVVKYLVSQGVSRSRLIDRGFGKTAGATVQTRDEKAKNRRVDLIMVSYIASAHEQPKH